MLTLENMTWDRWLYVTIGFSHIFIGHSPTAGGATTVCSAHTQFLPKQKSSGIQNLEIRSSYIDTVHRGIWLLWVPREMCQDEFFIGCVDLLMNAEE